MIPFSFQTFCFAMTLSQQISDVDIYIMYKNTARKVTPLFTTLFPRYFKSISFWFDNDFEMEQKYLHEAVALLLKTYVRVYKIVYSYVLLNCLLVIVTIHSVPALIYLINYKPSKKHYCWSFRIRADPHGLLHCLALHTWIVANKTRLNCCYENGHFCWMCLPALWLGKYPLCAS